MQAIKQNTGKQCNASDMQGKTKAGAGNGAMQEKMQAGTQNDANASKNGCRHAKRGKCKRYAKKANTDTQNDAHKYDMQRKQVQARKTMQTNAGTQNDANAMGNKCMHTKRGNCIGKQMLARKTMKLQRKINAYTQNDAIAKENKCMHAK